MPGNSLPVAFVSVLAPGEPNVYRPCGQPLLGAPAERNVLVDESVEPYISLRWSEEPIDPEDL
jgi:hypothetical protein